MHMKVHFTSTNVELNAKGFKDAIRIIKNSQSNGHVVVTHEVEGNTVAVAAFISSGANVRFTEPVKGTTLPGSYTIPAKLTPVALPPPCLAPGRNIEDVKTMCPQTVDAS
jgi:hypothetical protein